MQYVRNPDPPCIGNCLVQTGTVNVPAATLVQLLPDQEEQLKVVVDWIYGSVGHTSAASPAVRPDLLPGFARASDAVARQ